MMEYIYRFVLSSLENKSEINYLDKKNIEYEMEDGICVVKLNSSCDQFDKVYKKLFKVYTPLITAIYNSEDFKKAKWYTIRSKWIAGYPQPEDDFPEGTYDLKNACSECYFGITQVNKFRIKKEFEWKNRHFFMLYWVSGELFVKSETAILLKDNDIIGFEMLDLKLKTEVCKETKQMIITNKLEPGLIINESIKMVMECEKCGNKSYYSDGRQLVYKKSIFDNLDVDIIKSYEVMGNELVNSNKILISKKFYNFLIDNKLDKNLVIEPIRLVD